MPEPVVITSVRDRVGELFSKMGGFGLYRAAREEGHGTLSALIEANDQSTPEERRQGYDGFTRMLELADIRTQGDRWGSFEASRVEDFGRGDNERALFPEWARRQWDGHRAQSLYLSSDFAIGTVQRPFDDDTQLRTLLSAGPVIPLNEIIARTRPNAGSDYRARRLVEPVASDIRLVRVAEASELPKARISETQTVIRLFKYGRQLEASYEALRRTPLDDLAVHIRKLSIQTEVDQVAAAFDIMVNGDGNAGTSAPVFNLTALDSAATPPALTLKAWVAFRNKWTNPYTMTHVVGREAAITALLLLAMPNANLLLSALPGASQINQSFVPINNRTGDSVRYGITSDVAASILIGFDGRLAIEHVRETGSEIAESERWITRQTETLTFSYNDAFAVFDPNTVKILNLLA